MFPSEAPQVYISCISVHLSANCLRSVWCSLVLPLCFLCQMHEAVSQGEIQPLPAQWPERYIIHHGVSPIKRTYAQTDISEAISRQGTENSLELVNGISIWTEIIPYMCLCGYACVGEGLVLSYCSAVVVITMSDEFSASIYAGN